jgi:hypothetical protein
MSLMDLIYPAYKTISIVGTSKNAGKTVAMNQIIAEAEARNITLGLISTGRDGERRDVVTNTEKPAIYAKAGTIVTMVENSLGTDLEGNRAGIELLEVTGYNTPMGKVLMGKVQEEGYVEISGPRSVATIKEMCGLMRSAGAELVIVDGSLDRRASAAPFVSEGTIIAAGAAMARSMEAVIQKTEHLIELYRTPRADEAVLDMAAEAMENKQTVIVEKNGCRRIVGTQTSLNAGAAILEQLTEDARYILLSGAVNMDTIRAVVLNCRDRVQVVVKDATRIFLTESELFMLNKLGMNLRVVDQINMIAVTVNPYSPEGYYFEPEEFLKKMRHTMKGIPVLDVMQEGC